MNKPLPEELREFLRALLDWAKMAAERQRLDQAEREQAGEGAAEGEPESGES